nr:hypothetical transcript [Hymenolepis microstoma]
MNHQQYQHSRYQNQRHHSPQQVQESLNSHPSLPTQMYNLTADQTLVDQEGTVRRLSTAQRERLSQDLAVVQTNLHILNDMLTELQPDAISSDDLELLQELNETCRMMQQRVAGFLSQVADDAATLTLLQLNDELNSAFQRYERFERYRLRSMRAQIANQNAGHNRPPFSAITQSGSSSHPNQLQLQHETSQTTQANHLPAPASQLSLPSTSTDHSSNSDNQQKDDDNQSVDDDDELLDAVAEQTQRNESTSGELVSVADWTDNALALQALRLNDTSGSTWNSDPNAAQLERVFGAGYRALTLNQTDNQTSQPALQSLPGPQLEPLQPQPAPLPAPKPASQQPIKKRTPSEVRRLEEALLLFDS